MTEQNPNEHEEPIVHDKRRIDPETGKVRDVNAAASDGAQTSPDAGAAPAGTPGAAADSEHEQVEPVDEAHDVVSDDEINALLDEAANAGESADGAPASADAALAAERLHDLQRLQAEYANYRRRTEREKEEARDAVTADVLRQVLPVLDDLDRAEKAGDLDAESTMGVIAAKLRGALEKQGLAAYGEAGEAFDPQRHEAIAQLPNPAVETDTVADVVERGYTVGERTVRVAKVAVFVPAS